MSNKTDKELCDEMRKWFAYNPENPSKLRMTKRLRKAIAAWTSAKITKSN